MGKIYENLLFFFFFPSQYVSFFFWKKKSEKVFWILNIIQKIPKWFQDTFNGNSSNESGWSDRIE